LPDKSKPKEEKQDKVASEPEEKVEEQEITTEPETVEEKPEETVKTEKVSREIAEEKREEKTTESKESKETPVKTEEPESTEKAISEAKKETTPKKKDDKDDDFQYIVRISNTDISGDKNIVYGLASIKGIGMHMASLIMEKTGMDRKLKMGKLTDSQIQKLQNAIDSINEDAPRWMLNHRKDYETGEDIHLIGPDIDMKLRDEINIMKKIRSYRGIRHERGLPARGQRTRANNRRGLALGVSKKRDITK